MCIYIFSSQIDKHRSRARPRDDFYDSWTCLGAPIFCVFGWDHKKAAPNPETSVFVFVRKQAQIPRITGSAQTKADPSFI